MKRFFNAIKSISHMFLIAIKGFIKSNWKQLIFLSVVLVLFFIFSFDNVKRLWLSIKYFFQSNIYYITADKDNPGILKVPLDYLIEDAGGSILNLIPVDFQVLIKQFKVFGALLINGTFWKIIGIELSFRMDKGLVIFNMVLVLAVTVLLLSLFRKYKKNDVADDTRALKRYKRLIRNPSIKFFKKINTWRKSFFKKWLTVVLIIIFAVYLNLPVILLDLISNYFHFLGTIMNRTIDWNIIWKGTLAVIVDFVPKWLTVPFLLRFISYYLLFDLWRLYKADKTMEKKLDHDVEFLDTSGQQILFLGVSGAGKDALGTCLGTIYKQIMFPRQLLNTMLDIQKRFPQTNWAKWMDKVKSCKENGIFHNQLDIFNYIKDLVKAFNETNDYSLLYLEPGTKYEKWDGLTIESLTDALRDWMLAYFLYIHENPYGVANYTVMFNDNINPKPHYLNVDKTNILKETPKEYQRRKSCVRVNYDFMRPGVKFANYEKPNYYVYDFGVFLFTEFGKERGNSDSVKKESGLASGANRNNDKTTENLKTWRHGATLRKKPAFKIIANDQKNTGVNKETRGTFETIITLDTGNIKKKFGLQHWWFEQFVLKWIFQHFDDYTLKREEIKINKSLPNYLMSNIVSILYFYYLKRINTYSFDEYHVYRSNGSLEDVKQEEYSKDIIYLFHKIAYGRYNTANLHKAYLDRMSGSKIDFDDLPTFKTLTPTPAEWKDMNSYAAKSIFNIKYGDE